MANGKFLRNIRFHLLKNRSFILNNKCISRIMVPSFSCRLIDFIVYHCKRENESLFNKNLIYSLLGRKPDSKIFQNKYIPYGLVFGVDI